MSREIAVARFRRRLVMGFVGASSVVAGVIAGCGIDELGTMGIIDNADASDRGGPSLPEGGGEGSVGVDAADAGDANTSTKCELSGCGARGGYCDDAGTDTCTIVCTAASCDGGVTCPPGVPCKVSCPLADTCNGRIDCTKASSCDISCAGKDTCFGVDCAGTTCKVACTGDESCQKAGDASVDCRAGVCDITCKGNSTTCEDPVVCKSARCAVNCEKDTCGAGVVALGGDASITCGDSACGPAAQCIGTTKCQLRCVKGTCVDKLCCDSGVCLYDGGNGDMCP